MERKERSGNYARSLSHALFFSLLFFFSPLHLFGSVLCFFSSSLVNGMDWFLTKGRAFASRRLQRRVIGWTIGRLAGLSFGRLVDRCVAVKDIQYRLPNVP